MATHRKILGIVVLSALALFTLGCGSTHPAAGEEWETMSHEGKWWAFTSWHAPRESVESLVVAIGFGSDIPRAGVGFYCGTDADHKEGVYVYFSDAISSWGRKQPYSRRVKVRWGDGTLRTENLDNLPSPWPHAVGWPDTRPALENLLANDRVTARVLYQKGQHALHDNRRELVYRLDISGASAGIEQARAKCRE